MTAGSVHIFPDSVQAVRACRKNTSTNQQAEDSRILAKELSKKVCILDIKWIPGHQGILGNARADVIVRAQLQDSASHTDLSAPIEETDINNQKEAERHARKKRLKAVLPREEDPFSRTF